MPLPAELLPTQNTLSSQNPISTQRLKRTVVKDAKEKQPASAKAPIAMNRRSQRRASRITASNESHNNYSADDDLIILSSDADFFTHNPSFEDNPSSWT